jgi:hypothetical protein
VVMLCFTHVGGPFGNQSSAPKDQRRVGRRGLVRHNALQLRQRRQPGLAGAGGAETDATYKSARQVKSLIEPSLDGGSGRVRRETV